MWAFVKSVVLGTAAGAALPMVLTVTLAITSMPENPYADDRVSNVLWLLWLALSPIAITLPIVLGASAIFGLPLTVCLKRKNCESAAIYLLSGAALGLLIPLVFLASVRASEGYWLSLLGVVSGTVTALTWWIERREQYVR